MKLLSFFGALGILGFLLALFTAQHGCASDCGNHCPATTVTIGSPDDVELDAAFDVNGPACPPRDSVICTGDESSTYCTHISITGQSASWCDVLVAFDPYNDGRPWQVIRLQFGPTQNSGGTCCKGYPVLGPSTYIIPDHPQSGGVFGVSPDGSAQDAMIFTLHDAAADAPVDASTPTPAEAGTDGHADAGTDAHAGG